MSITEFIVTDGNGISRRFFCNDKGIPVANKRAPPRHDLHVNELEQENLFLRQIDQIGFKPDNCVSIRWLSYVLQESNLKHSTVISFAKLFSILLGIVFPREVYRRKKSCLFWLEQNIQRIDCFLHANIIQCVYNQKALQITPPYSFIHQKYTDNTPPPTSQQASTPAPSATLPKVDNLPVPTTSKQTTTSQEEDQKKVVLDNDILKYSLDVPDFSNPCSTILLKPLQKCSPLDTKELDQILKVVKR